AWARLRPIYSARFHYAKIAAIPGIPSNVSTRPQTVARLQKEVETLSFDQVVKVLDVIISFDVIISDMSRPPDKYAGYTLLEKMKSMDITTPFIIYASGKKPEYVAEAKRRGAFGSTNEPQELLEMVIQAIRDAPASTTRQSMERSR